MNKKKIFFSIIFFLIILIILYLKYIKQEKVTTTEPENSSEIYYNSNVIEDVYYSSKDSEENEYIITASKGEIDYKQTDIIYLTNVKAIIKLANSNVIEITSKYGKHNSNNFDTIFSNNIVINYHNNKITAEYIDFSMQRSSMIISREVVYTNLENILKADIVEIDLKNKDTRIFMNTNDKKISITTK